MDFTSLHVKIERLLKKRAFVGHYKERRFVNALQEYRDVICLPNEETELIKDLMESSKQLQDFHPRLFPSFSYPGELGAPAAHCLWTELSQLPFGCYWFQIRSVVILDNEVLYKLKSLREITDKKFDTRQATPVSNVNDSTTHSPVIDKNFLNHVTVVGIVRFLSILLATLVTGSFHVVKFTGDFTINLLREASVFIRSSTPLMLGMMDFCSKVVGGFYILLAMLWRGGGNPNMNLNPNNRPAIMYDGPPYKYSEKNRNFPMSPNIRTID